MLYYTMLLFSVFMVIDFVLISLLMVLSKVTLTYIARILYSMNIEVTGLLK